MTYNQTEGMAPIDIADGIRNKTLPLCPASKTQFRAEDIEKLLWNIMRLSTVPGTNVSWDRTLQITGLGKDAAGRPAATIRLIAKKLGENTLKTAAYEITLCNYCDYSSVCNFKYFSP